MHVLTWLLGPELYLIGITSACKCVLITVRGFILRIYCHRLSSMKFTTSETNELDSIAFDGPACPKVS